MNASVNASVLQPISEAISDPSETAAILRTLKPSTRERMVIRHLWGSHYRVNFYVTDRIGVIQTEHMSRSVFVTINGTCCKLR